MMRPIGASVSKIITGLCGNTPDRNRLHDIKDFS